MSFQSEFTGKQMEKAFRRITNMAVGTAVSPPVNAVDGFCLFHIENAAGRTGINYKAFVNVHIDNYGPDQQISASAGYSPTVDRLSIKLFGGGVHSGASYTVDYLLTE